MYLVCVILNVPRFSGRVQRSFKPADISWLELVINVDELDFLLTRLLIHINDHMTTMVASCNSNTLWSKVYHALYDI